MTEAAVPGFIEECSTPVGVIGGGTLSIATEYRVEYCAQRPWA